MPPIIVTTLEDFTDPMASVVSSSWSSGEKRSLPPPNTSWPGHGCVGVSRVALPFLPPRAAWASGPVASTTNDTNEMDRDIQRVIDMGLLPGSGAGYHGPARHGNR